METKKFKLNVTVDTEDNEIKDKCMEALAEYLKQQDGYFDVNYIADSWEARLVDEQIEVKDKLAKLVDFINSEKFYKLSPNNKLILRNQKIAMELYLNILNMRVYEDIDSIVVPDYGYLQMMGNMFGGSMFGSNPNALNFNLEKEDKIANAAETKA